jgi:hypothetical protein
MTDELYKYEGWFGVKSQVLHYLRVVGADRDEEGRFILKGEVASYMGLGGENVDVAIPAETQYFVNGQPRNLAAGLRSTSYGLKVYVIGGGE